MKDRAYVLLVEDEPVIQEKNKRILERHGYAVRQAFTLTEAKASVAEEPPSAIVLDIQLPDGNGLDFLQELRKTSTIPVMILTAMGTPQDIVRGFETGGDDYLSKPYELPVFLKRVEALIRRASIMPDTLVYGPIRIDTASNRAYADGRDLGLQPKELSLLQQFIQHPDETMSAESLYEKVWGQKMAGDDSTIKAALSKLRSKLTNSGYTITASRGKGYFLETLC